MKSLFGRIHLGRLPDEQQRHQALLKLLRKIMATAEELIADINAVKDKLTAANTKLTKIGTETDGLLAKIKELEDAIAAGNVPQSVVDAFNSVKEQAGTIETALQAQDDKVPDAPTP